MILQRQRRHLRRRALVLTATVLLLWCQIAAAFHATSFAVAGTALDQTPAEMAQMVGCDGLPDTDGAGGSDCLSEHATSDVGKLPVLAPLAAALTFALARGHETDLTGSLRNVWTPGRPPPRSRLCSWLI